MSERLSLLATAIIAALGWLMTYYVDRVTGAPTIEYSIQTQTNGATTVGTFRLTNISRTQSFSPVEVHFLPRNGTLIKRMDVAAVEPASEGPNTEEYGEGNARFVIERLMPGSSIDLVVTVAGSTVPKMHVDSTSPIRLTRPSFETWLVKNEMCLVLILIGVWLALLLAILLSTSKAKPDLKKTIRLEIATQEAPNDATPGSRA